MLRVGRWARLSFRALGALLVIAVVGYLAACLYLQAEEPDVVFSQIPTVPLTNTTRDGFLWGTATAAHQIEGGNVWNDWAHFEQQGLRYELEERAAILEYDGGLGRDQAEKQAINELFERTDHLTIDDRQLL